MNYLWGGMIVIGVVYAILTGNLDAVTEQALVSAKEAISLCITMAGAMAFWVGIMRIAERAGMIERRRKWDRSLRSCFHRCRSPAERVRRLQRIWSRMCWDLAGRQLRQDYQR